MIFLANMPNEAQNYTYDKHVVTIGGGTGHFTVLQGLVQLNNPEKITAIPGTWDSGGSSGRLRVEEGVLPMGDYMQCLLALMEDPRQLQAAINLLNNRSSGHPLRNLIAANAERVYHSTERAIDGLRDFWRIRGNVVLVSLLDLHLNAKTRFGKILEGEEAIDNWRNQGTEDYLQTFWFDKKPPVNPKAIEAIEQADQIIIAPGSPVTSIFSHFAIPEVAEAFCSSPGQRIAVLNLMTTDKEAYHIKTASNWLEIFFEYTKNNNSLDYLICNDNNLSERVLSKYRNQGQEPIKVDIEQCHKLAPTLRIIHQPLAAYDLQSDLYRHDPLKLADTILKL